MPTDDAGPIPKFRLDALTDGVFGVAMTLLVIDLRLPESFDPKTAAELLHRLHEMWGQALVYVVSFYVVALRWLGLVRTVPRSEMVSDEYTRWALLHLFLITLVPFTTVVMARYTPLAPAIWLYAANIVLMGLVAMRMITLADRGRDTSLENYIGLIVLIAAALLTVVASLFVPKWALFGYLLNIVDQPLRLMLVKRKAGRRGRAA